MHFFFFFYRLPFLSRRDKMEDIREGFDEPYGGDVGFPGDGGSRLSKCESGASKSEDITRRLAEKYIPIILSRNGRNN